VWFLVHLAPNPWTSQPECPPCRPADALLVRVIVTTMVRDAGRRSEITEQVWRNAPNLYIQNRLKFFHALL